MVVAANGDSQIDDVIRNQKQLDQIKGVDWTAPDTKHPHVIRNLTIWNAHYAFRPHSPSMLMENIRIHDVAYGIYRPAFDNQVYKNVNMSQAGGEPFNRGMDDAACQVGQDHRGRPAVQRRGRPRGEPVAPARAHVGPQP